MVYIVFSDPLFYPEFILKFLLQPQNLVKRSVRFFEMIKIRVFDSKAELGSIDIANLERRIGRGSFYRAKSRHRCISERVFQLLMATSRVTIISGRKKGRRDISRGRRRI